MPRREKTNVSFEIEERMCPSEAVQNAAYTFTDRAYVSIKPASAGKLRVVMPFKAGTPAGDRGALRGEFDNELLHQALRLRVSAANSKIREFIVTKALVSAQPAAAVAAAMPSAEACSDCAPAPVDAALEKEIDRLLAEIEKGDGTGDPLGVSVPWEEKFAGKAEGKPKAKGS